MVAAMILFILAVFSILIIFNVFNKQKSINSHSLDDFERTFMEKADNFTKVGINIAGTGATHCVNVAFNENLGQENVAVFLDNERVSSSLGEGSLVFDAKDGFFEIYNFSFEVEDPGFSESCIKVDNNYNYTIPTSGKIFSSDKLNDTALSFEDANFVISYQGSANTIELVNTNKKSPKGADVFAKTFFIKVFDQTDKQIKNCQVNIQVW